MKVGLIDLGSNTSKLLIAKKNSVSIGQCFEVLVEKSFPCRLFSVSSEKELKISKERSLRLVECLKKFQNICQKNQTNHLIVVATEALRKAGNSKEVIHFIKSQTGLKIRILSGSEEAEAVNKGLQTDPVLLASKNYFALDIGGGSIEIITVSNKKISNTSSLPIGAVSLALANSSNLDIPLSPGVQIKTREFVRQMIQTELNCSPAKGFPVIGTGGTLVFLHLILKNMNNLSDNRSLQLPQIEKIAEEICCLSLNERVKRFPSLPYDRADVFPFGLLAIIEIMKLFGANRITHSFHNLRYGMVQDFFRSLDS